MNATLENENLGNRTETIDASIKTRIQELKERISVIEDTIEHVGTLVKEYTKCQEFLTQNIEEFWDTMKKPNLTIEIEVRKDFQFKKSGNIFNKIVEENFPNLNK